MVVANSMIYYVKKSMWFTEGKILILLTIRMSVLSVIRSRIDPMNNDCWKHFISQLYKVRMWIHVLVVLSNRPNRDALLWSLEGKFMLHLLYLASFALV